MEDSSCTSCPGAPRLLRLQLGRCASLTCCLGGCDGEVLELLEVQSLHCGSIGGGVEGGNEEEALWRMEEEEHIQCWRCGLKYFKDDSYNRMKCPKPGCGSEACFVCKLKVHDHSHFYGQGGVPTSFKTCPLWSTRVEPHIRESSTCGAPSTGAGMGSTLGREGARPLKGSGAVEPTASCPRALPPVTSSHLPLFSAPWANVSCSKRSYLHDEEEQWDGLCREEESEALIKFGSVRQPFMQGVEDGIIEENLTSALFKFDLIQLDPA